MILWDFSKLPDPSVRLRRPRVKVAAGIKGFGAVKGFRVEWQMLGTWMHDETGELLPGYIWDTTATLPSPALSHLPAFTPPAISKMSL